MKKIIIPILATFFVVGGVSAAQLWEYGSFNERADKAVEIGLVDDTNSYVGSYEQNLILLDYYEPRLGVAIPKVIAWFEDTLQASITASSTSLTLVDGTDKEGTALSGSYGLTIDEGGANEELIIATCSGTSCTSLTRGVSVADGETSIYALIHSHRRGASIKITDAPTLIIMQRIMNGDEGFPNLLWYDDQPTFASTTDIVTKKYVDDVGAGGFTASNISSGYGLYEPSSGKVGVYTSATSSGLIGNWGYADSQLKVNNGYGMTINSEGELQVSTSSDFNFTGTFQLDGVTLSGLGPTATGTAVTNLTTGSTTPADYHHGHQQSLVYLLDNTAASVTGQTEATLVSLTIPAGDMDENSRLRITINGGVSDSASGSFFGVRFGGETIVTSTVISRNPSVFRAVVEIQNLSDLAIQDSFFDFSVSPDHPNFENYQASSTPLTIDTTSNSLFEIIGDNSGATATLTVSSTVIELIK